MKHRPHQTTWPLPLNIRSFIQTSSPELRLWNDHVGNTADDPSTSRLHPEDGRSPGCMQRVAFSLRNPVTRNLSIPFLV